jgi:hypothetical protein
VPRVRNFGAEPTQQEKLTIRVEGLFTEMAKKAFKRLRIAAPWRGLASVLSRQSKINLPLLIWARSAACFPALRPTRKGVAGRWPTFAFARDRNTLMVQRFRKIM